VSLSGLLTLVDDIAILLDDVAILTKAATKKTAGVIGDDLALNAEVVTGVEARRELPVVFAVAKGSAINKLVLVPAALVISTFAPWAVTPLLMLGGAFLCFEGFEKAYEKLFHREDEKARHVEHVRAVADPKVDMVAFEKKKIRGAVRTDFILSAEILVISMGTLTEATFVQRVIVLVIIAVVITVGVYGLVAGIVKLDDAGLALSRRESSSVRAIGTAILRGAPYMMKILGIAGTIAMFMVGGGIITHGVPFLAAWSHALSSFGGVVGTIAPTLFDAITGIALGGVLTGIYVLVQKVRKRGAR
jgi:predicted DNA repair protein MutK